MVHIFSLRSPEAFYRVIFLRLTFKVCQFLRLTAIGFKPYSGPRNWKKVKEKLNIACELKKKKKGKRTRKWNCFATPVCRDRAWHNPNSEVAFVILSLRHKSFIIASERRGGGMGRILVVGRLKSLDRPYKALFYSCNSPTLTVNWQSIFYSHTKFSGPRPPIPDLRPPTLDPIPHPLIGGSVADNFL